MFDYISGKIDRVGENKIVVDCGGVGFLLAASSNACVKYAQTDEAKIPVYLAVREDALELYGFADETERKLFMLLIGVSGVGAKLAVSVLSGMPTERIIAAIGGGDASVLATVKGVGKKTAERIVLELKSKVDTFGIAAIDATPEPAKIDTAAVSALMGLGYERKEAETAVKRVFKPDMTTEEIVRAVLSSI